MIRDYKYFILQELYAKIATLSTELEKSRTEFANLSTASNSKDAEYEQTLKGLATGKEVN